MKSKLSGQQTENNDDEEKPTIRLPWIPNVSSKLKKAYKKAGYKTVFKSGPNLQTILTSKNKTKLPENSHPGVYKIPCKCNLTPPYIGETKVQIATRGGQHELYVSKGQWEKSGAALHQRDCGCGFAAIKTIKVERNKFDRLVREALEIQYHQSGPSEGNINQDDGRYVKTKFWIPMLRNLRKKEGSDPQIRERRRHRREQTQINSSIHLTSDLASDEVIPTQVGS